MKHTHYDLPYYLASDDFYAHVKKRMRGLRHTTHTLTLVTLDFDHFNYVNDLFGYETGDAVLTRIRARFSGLLSDDEVFSNIHADHFAFCIHTTEQSSAIARFLQLADLRNVLAELLPPHYSLVVCGGMVVVQDDITPLSSLLDKANYARKRAKGGSTNRFLFYDEKMDCEVQWQKAVTLTMQASLKKREFEMYLQPKVIIQSDEVVGAEALVRWNSPQYGLIAPDRFIPIMEQNGFVCQLDFFVLGEACAFLKQCMDSGKPVLPISVNFSKAHLAFEHLVDNIFQTVNNAGIPPRLIEIEFTENLFAGDFETLIEVVTNLKLLGFRVSLDDFGSAYSSLNCLKDLPIDIVKIDKGFLDASTNSDNGKVIVAKTVELIKSLRKISVMEGIENQEQAEFLGKLCCDFGQGYFYGRPMPVRQYLSYLSKSSIAADIDQILAQHTQNSDSSYQQVIPLEFQMDNWELYTLGKSIDMGLMKGYLDNSATMQYVNERALEYLGYSRQEFHENLHNSILSFTHPADVPVVRDNIAQLAKTQKNLVFQTRAIRKDGTVIILCGRASCVSDNQGRLIGIFAFQDITAEAEVTTMLQQSLQDKICELEITVDSERQMRDALRINEERYRVIMDQSDDVMFEWDFDSDFISFSAKYTVLFGTAPILQGVAKSPAARDNIYPDDLPAFEQWVQNTYRTPNQSTAQFRVRDGSGSYIWVRYRSSPIYNENGVPVKAVGVLSNINAQKKELDTLTLKAQRDPLTQLLNKEETRVRIDDYLHLSLAEPCAFFLIDIDNFKGLNDNLGHLLGDTVLAEISHKIQDIFPTGVIGRIGGDEIGVFLPECASSLALAKAEALAQALHLTYYGCSSKYEISVSIGISFFPEHGSCFAELYRLADIALYESKHNGKNCVTAYCDNITGSLQNNQTPVECSESFLNTYFQNDFPFQIFKMLYETKDINTSMHMILNLLGTRYQVDRVSIFQNDEDGVHISNTYEWCAPGTQSEQPSLQQLSKDCFAPYFDQYNSEGVFLCPDVEALPPTVRAVCAQQNIRSLLHCSICNEGQLAGFIGFDMCTRLRDWSGEEIAILGYISRILSVFLIKTETAAELRTSYQNHVQMLENLNGFVYVIDAKTYELLYLNRATLALGVSTGSPCYEIAFGANEPCPNCPMNKFSDTVHYSTEQIYSEILHCWVNSAASKMKWEGVRDAVLVCCTDLSNYTKCDNPCVP